jgi:phosphoenolpyruvate carboxykinase (ATP)
MEDYFVQKPVYVQDVYAGADPETRIRVRVITETAWHSLFAHNMFRQPDADEMATFEPDYTVIHAPNFKANPARDGTNSEAFVLIHLSKRLILIGGTHYAGEIKKAVFGVMNYLLPGADVLPMHCAANMSEDGEVALFFGLSGTGKTTLSADAARVLIGDDEHGWSEAGVFNMEGGCYAKTIHLSPDGEPEIYGATQRFGTILENVMLGDHRQPNFDDATLTQNTRCSYPLEAIANASTTGQGGHPQHVIFLTADAFGVLPPVSKLTPEQASYHFLNGYTAKVAGTEKGITEPVATFSACFGAPFMPLNPTVYADMLREKIEAHDVTVWLVNTGWTGGAFGTGHRIDLGYTRAIVRAILDGTLAEVETRTEPFFGLHIPQQCPGVPDDLLDPRATWADPAAYDRQAEALAADFETNYRKYRPLTAAAD